jgi:hypothetical protein
MKTDTPETDSEWKRLQGYKNGFYAGTTAEKLACGMARKCAEIERELIELKRRVKARCDANMGTRTKGIIMNENTRWVLFPKQNRRYDIIYAGGTQITIHQEIDDPENPNSVKYLPHEEAEVNTRLILAAPELRKLLARAMQWVYSSPVENENQKEMTRDYEELLKTL